jgi:lysophospholipase L1-like esterase
MKKLTALLLACSLASAVAQEAPKKEDPTIAVTAVLHKGTEGRITKYTEQSKQGEAQLVFLGDSITQGWEGAGKEAWEKHFAPLKAVNFGIGGDRTEHILYRFEQGNLDGLKPKALVLMIGTNNTGHRMGEAPNTAAGIKAILDGVAKKCPDTKVLLLAVFPRGEKPTDKMRVRNDEINAIIKGYADDKKVFFKDIGAKFLAAEGVLTREVMPDLLHLSPKGYDIWAESILEDVKKLMQ